MRKIWKPVAGYEGLYEVSICGSVKSYHSSKPKILRSKLVRGYRVITLCKPGAVKSERYVGKLILETFKGTALDMQVDHINRVKTDDRLSNLRWVTPSQNSRNQPNVLNSTSGGVHGVGWSKIANRWRGIATVKGRQYYTGYFDTIQEASKAVQKFEKENK